MSCGSANDAWICSVHCSAGRIYFLKNVKETRSFFLPFFSSRSTFIAYGLIENQFVEFMWPTRVSEMMQYSAKLRPAGINIYVSDIAAVGWRSSCSEIKHGKWRKRKEKGSGDKTTRAEKNPHVKNAIMFASLIIWFAGEKKMRWRRWNIGSPHVGSKNNAFVKK